MGGRGRRNWACVIMLELIRYSSIYFSHFHRLSQQINRGRFNFCVRALQAKLFMWNFMVLHIFRCGGPLNIFGRIHKKYKCAVPKLGLCYAGPLFARGSQSFFRSSCQRSDLTPKSFQIPTNSNHKPEELGLFVPFWLCSRQADWLFSHHIMPRPRLLPKIVGRNVPKGLRLDLFYTTPPAIRLWNDKALKSFNRGS